MINNAIIVKAYIDDGKDNNSNRLAMRPDLDALNDSINKAIKRLNDNGYEVIQMMPIISGWGTESYNKEMGYGQSFTDGVVILGKKI